MTQSRRSSLILTAMLLLVALFVSTASAQGYYLIGQVTEVDLGKREIVIGGEVRRLSSAVRFSSDRPGVDIVTGLHPGAFVQINASPDGRNVLVTELHVFEQPPL